MKLKLEGAQRACTPAETIARMKPWWPQAGITRVSEITGLDHCGIPVGQCVRPDAISLCVDSGKGATAEAAMASAMMEGFERHVGETAVLDTVTARGLDVPGAETRFQLIRGAFYNPHHPIDWTTMYGIRSNEPRWVPTACVRTIANQFGFPFLQFAFASCTNGLSAGNTLDEAVAGGLYEVIERDQVSNSFLFENHDKVVDLNTIEDSTLGGLVERLKSNGITPIIFDCTMDIGVPTYICYIYDPERNSGMYKGYAAHLSPEVAQCRALCEAVQARTVFMSGSRDDIFHKEFTENKTADKKHIIDRLLSCNKTVSSRRHDDLSTDSFVSDIKTILMKLDKAGIPEPLIKAFKHPYPCAVVKVAIPTLAGYYHAGGSTGRRL
jgi:ribosomal protein S12 methylthiotransferase accessory factor